MEQFSEDFFDIISDSAALMLNNKQKTLTTLHICYGFFSNPTIKEIAEKNVLNVNGLLAEIVTIVKDIKPLPDETTDLAQETKEMLKLCLMNMADSDELRKINPFDFMETVFIEKYQKSLFNKYGFTGTSLSKIKREYKRINLKKSLKTKDKSILVGLQDIKEPTSKHSAENFITNISQKVKGTKPFILDVDNKIEELMNVLLRKEKSNPLLIGKPGVGKSSIIEGLAVAINEGKVPDPLKNKKIIEINLSSLIAGTTFRGEFEKRFENIVEFLKKEPDAIIFIDEIHCMKGLGSTGASGNEMDFSNMIKPYLSSGKISCIGATTYDEYKSTIEKDKALDRRFKIVYLNEPTVELTKDILKFKKFIYEDFHNIKVSDQHIEKIVDLSDRFISKGAFPDKAFDVLDMCLAMAKMQNIKVINENLVYAVISKLTGIDETQIAGFNQASLTLESKLKEKIFGQNKAIEDISNKILVANSGLSNPLKPLASFLLIGTTGVGKTEVVNELSKQLNMDFIRFDMSEYSERGSASKLIGTSAGYIGFEAGGKLTEFVYHHPHSIILFDEIEKADSSIFNLFLQMLDYGKITDGSGKEIDFKNTLIFMTSNAGVTELTKKSIGFLSEPSKGKFEDAVNKIFSPEFRNRISKIITFEKLELDSMYALVEKNLKSLKEKLVAKKIELEFTELVKEAVIKNGFDEKLGARPLERYIEDNIAFMLAKQILLNKIKESESYIIDYVNNEFTFELKK